jgi:pseudouridine synthase
MPEYERLQKYLAHAGIASRRKCEELIRRGRVKVNGRTVTELGTKIAPETDKVEVDGKLVAAEEEKVYILLYKPKFFISSRKDPEGRETVVNLIKGINKRIYPVGRLDYDTEGLLLLTNDGELTYKLTHPKHEIEKVYRALVEGCPDSEDLYQLSTGVQLEDGMTAPAKVRAIRTRKGNTLLEITIHEGRNRQVRRMCEHIGHPVLKLKRIKFAFLDLGNLKPGEFRFLTDREIKKLKEIY